MTIKLDWNYDNALGCEVALLRGYRIRAPQDTDASNPFEDTDGNWPIMVRNDNGRPTKYDKVRGPDVGDPLVRFTDAQIIHDQIAIAKVLYTTIMDVTADLDEGSVKYCHDADVLRTGFDHTLDDLQERTRLNALVELYGLLGIPAYLTISHGDCQGDWAEILVVATPEAQEEFGCTIDRYEHEAKALCVPARVGLDRVDAWVRDKAIELMLEPTADLYGNWAWGHVYGYVVEKPVFDEDGDIVEWEDACPDNSCWGYFGDDHIASGLEEQALACVPDEPVRLPDAKCRTEGCDADPDNGEGFDGYCGNCADKKEDD